MTTRQPGRGELFGTQMVTLSESLDTHVMAADGSATAGDVVSGATSPVAVR